MVVMEATHEEVHRGGDTDLASLADSIVAAHMLAHVGKREPTTAWIDVHEFHHACSHQRFSDERYNDPFEGPYAALCEKALNGFGHNHLEWHDGMVKMSKEFVKKFKGVVPTPLVCR